MFALLWYVRQLCGLPAKVSLVQIGCQLLPPLRVEGGGEGHFRGGGEAVFGLAPGTGLRTLRGGMAETLPTGLGPTAGGIITSRPGEGLEPRVRAGLTVGEAPLAGLRGSGL